MKIRATRSVLRSLGMRYLLLSSVTRERCPSRDRADGGLRVSARSASRIRDCIVVSPMRVSARARTGVNVELGRGRGDLVSGSAPRRAAVGGAVAGLAEPPLGPGRNAIRGWSRRGREKGSGGTARARPGRRRPRCRTGSRPPPAIPGATGLQVTMRSTRASELLRPDHLPSMNWGSYCSSPRSRRASTVTVPPTPASTRSRRRHQCTFMHKLSAHPLRTGARPPRAPAPQSGRNAPSGSRRPNPRLAHRPAAPPPR
mgnify:CR=1 FL=1